MNSKTKRITALVGTILVLATVVWFVRGAISSGSRERGGRVEDVASSDARPTMPSSARERGGPTVRVEASQPNVPVQTPDESTAVTVEIVRADTRAPCPDARVYFWPARVLERVPGGFESWLRNSAIEDHHAEAAQARADEHGLAKVYDALDGGTVVASMDGLWGRFVIARGQRERVSIVLALDVELRARIVDASGAPVAACTVALRQPGHGEHTDHLLAHSGADGIAVLRHAGEWWNADSSMATGYVVAVPGLLNPPCARVLEAEALAAQPIELVLESSGTCDVEVFDGFGRKFLEPFEARLCFADAEAACEASASRSNGLAVFEHVELGRELWVEIQREGVGEASGSNGTGPTFAGERVHLQVHLKSRAASFAGRVVDPAGAPLGGLMLSAHLESGDGWRQSDAAWSTRTSDDGKFLLELSAPPATSDSIVLALSVQKGTEPSRVFARRTLPREPTPAAHALGDVTLEDAPVVAAGHVLDPEGHPVADAEVTAVAPTPSDEPGTSGRERPESLLSARSDAEGRFTLRGLTASQEITVRAHKAGYVDRTTRVRRGETALRLVLGEAGTIAGTVLIDASLRSTPVLVEVALDRARAVEGLEPSLEPTLIAHDGAFSVHDLCAGAYALRVVYAATGHELGKLERVLVENGRANRDERLNPLDLRASMRLIQLELIDENGALVRGGSCRSRASDEPRAATVANTADGARLPLLYAGRPLDVSVTAPGFLDMQLERVSESQQVKMLRAAKVRLELGQALTALGTDLRLGARLTPVDARRLPKPRVAGSGTFDGSGVLACEATFAGEVSIELLLTAADARNARVEYLKSCRPRTFRIEAHPMEQVFPIELDPSELARAIEAVRSER